MSAGAMVAGGLVFTIPGAWMLGHAAEIDWFQMLAVALAGVVLGLVCTALLRRHFIEDAELEYPIGQAAAQTLVAGDSGGSTGKKLFGAMGLAGLFTALRDGLGAIPSLPARWPYGSPGRSSATSASSWAARRRGSGTWPRRRASYRAWGWAL